MKNRSAKFTALMGSASLVAVGLAALAQPTFAQDKPAAKADDSVVVVTGQRAQIKSAQARKKDSDVIVDSVTAVDIGALPDRSVAEALQRISGLTIQRAAEARDPIRMTAEAGGVEIRGLAWVRSETNGRDIFSAKNGRALSWSDVSSDLLAGVDVYKNASADMIEGGIGGTVNLRTRLPFDSKKPIFAFTADDTYGDLQKKHQYSYSFLASDRWHTAIGEVGALFNYSLVNEGNDTNVIAVDRYVTGTLASTNQTVTIPNTMGWRTIDWDQKRQAANIALQWRPNDDVELTLSLFNAKSDPKNTEYNTGFYNDSNEFFGNGASYTFNTDGTVKTAKIANAGITSNTRYGEDHNETTDISLHGRWNVSSKFTLAGDVQYVKSTARDLSNTAFIQSSNKPTLNYTMTGGLPEISVSGVTTSDPSTYWWAADMDHIERNQGKELSARLDGQYDFDGGWLKNFKFGVRTTDKDYQTRISGWNWGFLSQEYWGGGPAAYINNAASGGPGSDYTMLDTFSNFMHGQVAVPGSIWFPSASLVNQGTAKTYDLLKSAETEGWGWTPLTSPSTTNDNTQTEKTTAAYATGTFAFTPNLWGEERTIDGNFGVRVVQTKSTGSSYIVVAAPTTSAACTSNCSLYTKTLTFGNGAFPYAGGGEYTNVLPSLNIRFKYNSKLQFRFAASEGMVRPDMAWLTPYSTLGSNFTIDSHGALTNATFTGTGGNPNLKAITATQFDWTGEWYFAPTGSLTLDLFAKDLKNYIYTQADSETFTNNGQTLTFDVTRYVNGTATGKVRGFELAYQQFYDALPGPLSGLGVQANYTHIDSSGGRNATVDVTDSNQVAGAALNGLPLEGMSPDSYNMAVMYEKYGISARLAYNWRSKYLYTTSAANVNRPLWAQAYGQLDGSVFYNLNTKLKLGVQVTNIGRSTTYQRVSSDLAQPNVTQFYSAIQTDRRVSVVLRGSF
ncbi:TonB-dependent receptor [Asticcacaulis solisilvae]|uniref:TonB-dependent receptor n=1 Tax=Asticcacaulis solisilvae TaxID=1217274 RepID=UPI003FD73D2D